MAASLENRCTKLPLFLLPSAHQARVEGVGILSPDASNSQLSFFRPHKVYPAMYAPHDLFDYGAFETIDALDRLTIVLSCLIVLCR